MTDPALPIAAELVARFESFTAEPRHLFAGCWEIGYGSTEMLDGSLVCRNTPAVTQQQALVLLAHNLTDLMQIVRSDVKMPISNHGAAALCHFAHTTGVGTFVGSLMRRAINSGVDLDFWTGLFYAYARDAMGNFSLRLLDLRDAECRVAMTPDEA